MLRDKAASLILGYRLHDNLFPSEELSAEKSYRIADQLLNLVKSEMDKLTVIDNLYPETTRFRDERYIDKPLHIGFGVGSKEQLKYTKKQLLDLW